MKFVVSSKELLDKLTVVSRVIGVKSALPTLNNFYFELEEDDLKIVASDLETTIMTSIPLIKSDHEGSVSFPSKILMDSLKTFSDQPITFDVDEKCNIVVHYETGQFALVGQPGDEYPKIPDLKDTETTIKNINANLFLDGISNTSFAIESKDEYRPVLNGILVEFKKDGVTFVATDSHKLVRHIRKDASPEVEASFILPSKPAEILKSFLSEEALEIAFNDRNASFKTADFKLLCKLIEGKYPAYASVIPTGNNNILTINRQEFCNALQRVAIFANQASNLIKLSFRTNELTLTAQDVDFATSSREHIRCQYDGEDLDIGFKSYILIDVVANMSHETIMFKLGDAGHAGIVVPAQPNENEDLISLVMPMMCGA